MSNIFVPQIVVVDDEKHICNIIKEALGSFNYNVHIFSDVKEGIEFIKNNKVDLVLTDLVMGEFSGVDVIDATQKSHHDAVVILMTAHPTVEIAIDVLKNGAYDFLIKPFKLDLLRATISRGLIHQQVIRDNVSLKEQVDFLKVINASAAEDNIEEFMKLVATSCKNELSATAVSLISIDPQSKAVYETIYESDDDSYVETICDASLIHKVLNTKSHQPLILKETVELDGQEYVKTFITQPICSRKKLMGIINIITINRFDRLTSGQLDILQLLSNSAASTFMNFKLYRDLEHSYLQAFSALANAIEARDAYTAGHTTRVCQLAELIALELGWNDQQLRHLQIGCTLHDIGKIGVPDSILNKQSKLTDEELQKMNSHPSMGLKIIEGIELFKPAIPYVISHHEKYDGSGYPNQLVENEIPIEGRLLAVADTFDAILSDRPYREGRSLSIAVAELRKYRGTQFDPLIVDTFIWIMQQGKIDFVQMYGREEDLVQLEESFVTEKAPA